MVLPRECEFKATLALVLALFVFGAECRSSGARRNLVGETVFDVTANGAKPDGKTESALAFIRTWNLACKSTGPAKLLIPKGTFMAGEVIFSGPCDAPQPITIEIVGDVLSRTDLSLYSNNIWITVQAVDGVIITGGGTLNGQGAESWKFDNGGAGGGTLLPLSLVLMGVKHSVVQGFKMVDSKGFHMKITDCENITVTKMTITAPGDSPNTDGCHISDSKFVTVSDSIIGTGDDCVSIGDGNSNITVTGITCGPGHGISIGSLGKRVDEENVLGVLVKNCTLTGTTNGARIKTYHDSPTIQASGIVFEDLVMNNVANPIIIDQHYNSKKNPKQSNVKLIDVHFRNIRGTSNTPVAIALNCSSAAPCENIELADIDLAAAPGGKATVVSTACANAKPIVNGILKPGGCV